MVLLPSMPVMPVMWRISIWFLVLRLSTELSLSESRLQPSQRRRIPFLSSHLAYDPPRTFVPLTIRGGASTTTTAVGSDVRAYRMQQQLYLQSRSLQLRQELILRGLDELKHGESDNNGVVAKPVDWDCALSSAEHPKSCLYSFDAELGAKVIAPIDTTQWITLTALNRLRRSDPTKVEPLWHSQFRILNSWFHPASAFSLYNHLSPTGTILALLLDAPFLLGAVMTVVIATGLLLTLPLWEGLIQTLLTSQFLWLQWPNWARFIHAALPLKLLLGQLLWKFWAVGMSRVYHHIRDYLVEWECQLLQDCIPLTVLEGVDNDIARDEQAEAEVVDVTGEEGDDDEDSDEDEI